MSEIKKQLKASCEKVGGDIRETSIVNNGITCHTKHGKMEYRNTKRRLREDREKLTISDKSSNLSSSTTDVQKIDNSWNRIVAKGEDTSFDLKGGDPAK